MANNFSLLIKKEIVDNKKPILLGLVGIWATYILIGAFLGYTGSFVPVEILLFLFFTSMILTIASSLTFSNMKTKEGRINTLMLPATAFHKFAVRWIATVPVMILVVIVGALVGDWVRLGVFKLTAHLHTVPMTDMFAITNTDILSYISYELKDEYEPIAFLICIATMTMLVVQAIYFLGSILWPKLSFIKTWAVMQVVQVLFGTVVVALIPWLSSLRPINIDMKDSYFALFLTVIIVCGLAICGLLYWLAYIRFKKSQVIYKLF